MDIFGQFVKMADVEKLGGKNVGLVVLIDF